MVPVGPCGGLSTAARCGGPQWAVIGTAGARRPVVGGVRVRVRPRQRRLRAAAVVPVLPVLFAVLLLAALVAAASPAAAEGQRVTLLYFGADGCPYCDQMEAVLDDLERTHAGELTIERHEVSGDPAARQRWVDELAARGQEASGVPTVVLGDRVWVGFSDGIVTSIEAAVAVAVAARAPPASDGELVGPEAPTVEDAGTLDVPLVGEVRLDDSSALGVTAAIAFVDGFNPCSLWVLMVLLAMVLNAGGSRRRLAAVGGTFLLVTGLLYGVFIVGVFTVLGLLERLDAIRVAVAVLALGMGVVNVKDYVAYKRGVSLTIPDRFKPRIYRAGRAVRDPGRSLPAVLGLTVVMAAGISLVELPCTAGFPVIWTGVLHTLGVEGAEFAMLLAVYLGIYVLDELLVFGLALATLRVTRLQEQGGRVLKLVGGAVMLALGVVLLAAPELMASLGGSLAVVGGAVVLALAVAGIHRQARQVSDGTRDRAGARPRR
jgi:cytochrome c biogenesis protein CcdA/glutaredoxin